MHMPACRARPRCRASRRESVRAQGSMFATVRGCWSLETSTLAGVTHCWPGSAKNTHAACICASMCGGAHGDLNASQKLGGGHPAEKATQLASPQCHPCVLSTSLQPSSLSWQCGSCPLAGFKTCFYDAYLMLLNFK